MGHEDLTSDPFGPTMGSSASSWLAEGGPCPQRPNPSWKSRPCKGSRERYRKLVASTSSRIKEYPVIFNMNELELNLPPLVKDNPWLKQKFMRRMETLKQTCLAELQQPMDVRTVVASSHDAEEPQNGIFEPMKVVMGHRDSKQQSLIVGTDKIRVPVQLPRSEGYEAEAAATMIVAPRVDDIAMPMKLLRHGAEHGFVCVRMQLETSA